MGKHLNNVRCRVNDNNRDAFVSALKSFDKTNYIGVLSYQIVDCGEGKVCTTVVWESQDDLIEARPMLIEFLDSVRPLLEEISPELGVTDSVSGEIILES